MRHASRLRTLSAKLRGFFGGQRDEGFDEEMLEHLKMLEARFVARGMTPREAAAAARRQFGNGTLVQRDRRDMSTLISVEALWQDLRYAMRTLWKSRGFAVVSIADAGTGDWCFHRDFQRDR